MNTVIYSRVSTDEQAESGAGLNAQRDACIAWAAQHGKSVTGHYTDTSISGTTDLEKRSGLLAAIAALAPGDTLLVAKRDRLARDMFVVSQIERLIAKRKAHLYALNGAVGETPEAKFLNGILDVSAAYEVALIRARTKAALAAKKARGERMGKLPFGFTTLNGIHVVPCPHEQQVLQRIATLRGAQVSLRKMAQTLNAEGVLNRLGQPWNHVLLHIVCKNLAQRQAVVNTS